MITYREAWTTEDTPHLRALVKEAGLPTRGDDGKSFWLTAPASHPIWSKLPIKQNSLDRMFSHFDDSEFEIAEWFQVIGIRGLGEVKLPKHPFPESSPGCDRCMAGDGGGPRFPGPYQLRKSVPPPTKNIAFYPKYEFDELCFRAEVFERLFDSVSGVSAWPLFGPGMRKIDGIVQLKTEFVHPLAGVDFSPPCEFTDGHGPGCGRVALEIPIIGYFPRPAQIPSGDVWRVEQPMRIKGRVDSRFPFIFHKRVVERLRGNGVKFGFHPLSPLVEELS